MCLSNFGVFEELVFFDLWILDSGFQFPVSVSLGLPYLDGDNSHFQGPSRY